MKPQLRPSAGLWEYHSAFFTYPLLWFENLRLRLVLAGLLIVPLTLLQVQLGMPGSWWLSAGGILCTIATCFADAYTTHLVLRLKSEFEKRGVPFPTHEANPLLPQFPTAKQMILNPTTLLIPLLIALVYVAPLISLLVLLIEGAQAVSNWMIWRRLTLTLALLDKANASINRVHLPQGAI
jgi:hypothetical protein